jgi:hypothetical protein
MQINVEGSMARDPYASAQFFHFIIHMLLIVIFGIKKKTDWVYSVNLRHLVQSRLT